MLGICRDEPRTLTSIRPDLPNELGAVIARLQRTRHRLIAAAG